MKGSATIWIFGIIFILIAIAFLGVFYLNQKYGSVSNGLKNVLNFLPSFNSNQTSNTQPHSVALVDSYGCDLRTFTCPADADYCVYTFSSSIGGDCPQTGRLEKTENYKTKTGCNYVSLSSSNQCKLLGYYNTGAPAPSTATTTTIVSTATTVPASNETTTTIVSPTGGTIIFQSTEAVSTCWYGGCNKVVDQLQAPWCCPTSYARCIVTYSAITKEVTPDSGIGNIKSTRLNICTVTGYK